MVLFDAWQQKQSWFSARFTPESLSRDGSVTSRFGRRAVKGVVGIHYTVPVPTHSMISVRAPHSHCQVPTSEHLHIAQQHRNRNQKDAWVSRTTMVASNGRSQHSRASANIPRPATIAINWNAPCRAISSQPSTEPTSANSYNVAGGLKFETPIGP
jgi:hypothetical protein